MAIDTLSTAAYPPLHLMGSMQCLGRMRAETGHSAATGGVAGVLDLKVVPRIRKIHKIGLLRGSFVLLLFLLFPLSTLVGVKAAWCFKGPYYRTIEADLPS